METATEAAAETLADADNMYIMLRQLKARGANIPESQISAAKAFQY